MLEIIKNIFQGELKRLVKRNPREEKNSIMIAFHITGLRYSVYKNNPSMS